MDHSVIQDALILLALAVAAVALFQRLKLPAILGYFSIGIIAGPHALAWIEKHTTTTLLGEIGVVFLLFTIGLEFSIPKFVRMRHALLGLGGTQVAIGTASGMFIAILIGIGWEAALIIGGALSLSSTAIVIKQLTDQLEMQKDHAHIAVGILLFQDLAAVPFLVMIPILASGDSANLGISLLAATAKGIAALLLMLASGRWILRPLFHEVAHARSAELFTLTALFVALAAAWVTAEMGLSLALGAFIAGMMLGETEYRHQIESNIQPFRDVLLGLFFITVSMQLDLGALLRDWPWVLLLVAGVIAGKGLVIVMLSRVAGYTWKTALRAGVALGQGGEFGLALLALALLTGLISSNDVQPILACIIISMMIAPVLIRHSETLIDKLYSAQSETEADYDHQQISSSTDTLTNHVIICGFGQTGQHIARFLSDENIPYAALETNATIVKTAWKGGERVFFGNSMNIKLLEAIGLQHAAAVIISFENTPFARNIIRHIRSIGCELPIIARAHDQHSLQVLLDAGASEVVPEDLETSLALATKLLIRLDVPMDDVLRKMREIQQDRYEFLNDSRLDSSN